MQSRGGVGGVGSGLKKEKREREREDRVYFFTVSSPHGAGVRHG